VVDVCPDVKPPTTTDHVRTYASRLPAREGLKILDLSVALPVTTLEVADSLAPTS
jgi:hypothetical protein